MSLDGKITLVTGASRGIGRAIAEALGNAGAVVIGSATTDSGADKISQYLSAAEIKGMGVKLNVSDPDSIADTLGIIGKEYGAPQILVNNAGITKDNLLMKMKDDEWNEVINTNLTSIYRLSKACLRAMMKARWGRIISVSSVVGSSGNPGQANYAASKAGINGFTRALAQEIGARGITVNSIAPGFIDTDMTRNLPDEQREKLINQTALRRLGEVEEIAGVVAFLASDAASYITGETLHVNGGMYMA